MLPLPVTSTFDLLTLKVMSESRVTWASLCAKFRSDRQTDEGTDRRQTASSLNALT